MDKPLQKKWKGDVEIVKNNLEVDTARAYECQLPYYCHPDEIGCFSTNSQNKYFDDDHQRKYLSLPDKQTNLNLDLSEGYDKYVGTYIDEENTYNRILRWICGHDEEVRKHFTNGISLKSDVDFVCYRGVLSTICSTIYEKNDEWVIHATKFGPVIYLCNVDTEQKRKREASMNERDLLMASWGYKFEQYITSDTVKSKPNTSSPVNVNEKFFVVMKGKLDNNRLLFSGETDAVDPQYTAESGKDSKSMFRYVEMKTSRILKNERQWQFFRFKLLKWYLQSYIAGISRVVCGFRDDKGIVREVKIYNVCDMPKMVQGLWSPAACLNFCSQFLNFVKQCVVKDDPKVVYEFSWKPNEEVTCEELSSEHQLLPDWYTERVNV